MHTQFQCPAWQLQRNVLVKVIGAKNLVVNDLVNKMLESKRSWEVLLQYAETVMAKKKEVERE